MHVLRKKLKLRHYAREVLIYLLVSLYYEQQKNVKR
jgi:hypothetical protein